MCYSCTHTVCQFKEVKYPDKANVAIKKKKKKNTL